MSCKLDPAIVARDVAISFCNQYVSNISEGLLDDSNTQLHAAVIYASAYDSAYEYIVNENKFNK